MTDYERPNDDRIPCSACGIPIPQPGEYPDPAALLCDRCYNALERAHPDDALANDDGAE